MPEIISVKPVNLQADSNNPRVPEDGLGQREVLLAIAKTADGEIAALARDIVQYQSLDPSSLPIVIDAKEPGRYTVLEGNRRLTALRALENPSMFEGAFSASVLDEIRKISTVYRSSPIHTINCCLMPNRASADHWLDLRHTGKNRGAGLVGWGPHEKARFTARTKQKTETHTRLLDFLEEGGHLKKTERQRVPVAAFARLVRTRSVREKLGFSTDKGGPLKFNNEKSAVSGLLHIAHDLASGKVKTGHIYDLEQRNQYAAQLPISGSPAKGGSVTPSSSQPSTGAKSPFRLTERERDKLIPQDWRANILDSRMKKIAQELRTLSLTDYPNSVAVLFRVFIEMSADHFLLTKMNRKDAEIRALGYSLKRKLTDITDHLVTSGTITKSDAAPVRSACQNDSFLAQTIVSMNEYVHNFKMNPTPTNLLTAWKSFDNFITVLWK